MAILAICLGAVLVLVVLCDTFETVVLPRTVTRRFRLTATYYRALWIMTRSVACQGAQSPFRSAALNGFGPLSLLLLLCFWAGCLIVGIALIQWGVVEYGLPAAARPAFVTDLYASASMFVTLGFNGASQRVPASRYIGVGEAGLGLGFLAIVIGYLPVIYQSFSRREVGISLLDARAGSPPSGGELLRRFGEAGQMETLCDYLAEWERWASDVLESHLSYPVLAYYRSQHDRESWLSALTAILDACALVLAGLRGSEPWQSRLTWQARMTYAMGRHTAIDLVLTLRATPAPLVVDRLPPERFLAVCADLEKASLILNRDAAAAAKLTRIREQYEPYINALAEQLLLDLPPWMPEERQPDNWQTSAWGATDHFNA